MNILIAASPKIDNKLGIETQIIDSLFESDYVDTFYLTDCHRGGNKLIMDYLIDRKRNIKIFSSSFQEHGIEAISKRNIEMMKEVEFALLISCGKSYIINNLRQICERKHISYNMRYLIG